MQRYSLIARYIPDFGEMLFYVDKKFLIIEE
jgi:hypothetical protein